MPRLPGVALVAIAAVLTLAFASPPPTSAEPASRLQEPYRGRAAVVYGGLAAGFATMGLGFAGFRGWTARCAEYESLSDCEADSIDLFFAVMQTTMNLHALAFAGAASGVVGRRAHDSRRTRVRLAAGGAASLTFGLMLGTASYVLYLGGPSTIGGVSKLIAGRALLAEAGAAAAITGVVLLARVVAQRHVERRSTIALVPSRGGVSLAIGGVF